MAAESCPYCRSRQGCSHLLLRVDTTFRSAEGGALQARFNERWSATSARGQSDPGFDERGAFDELLESVGQLADAERSWDVEGGPGQSSGYLAYFRESGTDDAFERWKGASQARRSAAKKKGKRR